MRYDSVQIRVTDAIKRCQRETRYSRTCASVLHIGAHGKGGEALACIKPQTYPKQLELDSVEMLFVLRYLSFA